MVAADSMPETGLPRALAGRVHILMCLACSGGLKEGSDALVCEACGASYPVRNRKIYFDEPPRHETAEAGIKEWLKHKLGPVYAVIVKIVAPVYPFSPRRFVLDHIDPAQNIVVDLGCGTQRIHTAIITVDLFDYDNVDIVCRLEKLPFRDNSVDAFSSIAVLEHVEDAFGIVRQIAEKTKPGGLSLHLIPFLYHFHESPRDYLRVTHMGAKNLFKGWTCLEVFNATGPISLFLMHFIEFASIVVSFRNGKAKEAVYLGLSALLFPIKYLDAFFVRREAFLSMAPTLCITVKKPDAP
jgi:hypothetical protein